MCPRISQYQVPTVALDMRMLEHSGIGTYLRHLMIGLTDGTSGAGNMAYRFYGPTALLSKHLPLRYWKDFGRFNSPIYGIREHWEYARLKKQWDLWHAPHFNAPFFKKGKLVVTVHDLIHLVYRDQFFNVLQGWYVKRCFEALRRNADAIIAVSHHTKSDLIKLAGVPADRITVIHEGVSPAFRPLEDRNFLEGLRRQYRLEEKFLLYVGNIKPHKNVGQLARAHRALKQKEKIEEGLAIIGRADAKWLARDKDLAAATSDASVRFVPEVPAEHLPGLYNLASAVVLPSLYEGFGLVVLEAMACGTPVIVSNRASLPEIAGNAAEMFDPSDDADLIRCLEKVTRDVSRRNQLRAAGLSRAKEFSWDRMAQETKALYAKALSR